MISLKILSYSFRKRLKKNKGLKENESTEILEKIEESLNFENKIEIDSFFMNLPGYNLNIFFAKFETILFSFN